MNTKKTLQTISTIIITTILLLITTATAVSANPYTGYNTIGSYWQYQHGYQGGYTWQHQTAPGGHIQLPNPYYNYQTTPRAGGWFGGGTGWITGLRQPYYGCVEPVHYSSFSRPNCGGGYTPTRGHGAQYSYMPPSTTRVEHTSVRFGFYG